MSNTLLKRKTTYRPQVRSRHPSHLALRTMLVKHNFKSVIRLGSLTELRDTETLGGNRLEINTVESIQNSSNKLLMKACFNDFSVPTAAWGTFTNHEVEGQFDFLDSVGNIIDAESIKYPIVVKHIYGSRGTGNTLVKSLEELLSLMKHKSLGNYIYESFFTGNKEYRLHVSKNGCFYTNRKMLRTGTDEDKRWFRNDSNSVWIMEDNEAFEKPVNWETIVNECVNALHSVGLDIGAIDLKVQSQFDKKGQIRENPEFIIIEINSAPSFGAVTQEKYIEQITLLLNQKNTSRELYRNL